MLGIQESFTQFIKNFGNQTVQCAGPNSDKVELDNPAYAQIDPHLSYDETEDLEQEQMPPSMRGPTSRPPSFDGLMNNIKAITKKIEHIKGFKLDFVMAASPHFHIVNSWVIPGGAPQAQGGAMGGMMGQGGPQMPGKNQQPHYGLSVQYVGGNIQQLMAQQHPSYILTGRWESNGKLECAFIKRLRQDIQLRVSAAYPTGSDLQYAAMIMDLDIEGNDYLHTLKYGNGMVSFNHMQTIGKNLVLGYEIMNIIDRKMAFLNYAAKYTHKRKHNFYMQYLAPHDMLSCAYSLNLKKRTHLVSEFNYSPKEGSTNAVIGYQQRFTNSEVVTTLNSKGKISTSFNMIGMFYALKLCAIADYKKDSYKFGYGLSLGQQQ